MPSKKVIVKENVIPEDGDTNPLRPIVTYRGAQSIIGGADQQRQTIKTTGTGGVKYDFANAAYYKPSNVTYDKDMGVVAQEMLMDKQKVDELSQDIADMYAYVNPKLSEDKRRNAMYAQIYNEVTNVPSYIAQGAADLAISAYDGILSLNTNYQENAWNEYISKFDENDQDVQSLQVALINSANKGFNPLYMDVNKLTGINGQPLSDKSKEIFQEYRNLLYNHLYPV